MWQMHLRLLCKCFRMMLLILTSNIRMSQHLTTGMSEFLFQVLEQIPCNNSIVQGHQIPLQFVEEACLGMFLMLAITTCSLHTLSSLKSSCCGGLSAHPNHQLLIGPWTSHNLPWDIKARLASKTALHHEELLKGWHSCVIFHIYFRMNMAWISPFLENRLEIRCWWILSHPSILLCLRL